MLTEEQRRRYEAHVRKIEEKEHNHQVSLNEVSCHECNNEVTKERKVIGGIKVDKVTEETLDREVNKVNEVSYFKLAIPRDVHLHAKGIALTKQTSVQQMYLEAIYQYLGLNFQ